MSEENKDSMKAQLDELQFGPVVAKYRGKTLEFYPISSASTIDLLDIYMQFGMKDILEKPENRNIVVACIAESLRYQKERIAEASPGFVIFALQKVLEAIDVDFFLEGWNLHQMRMKNLMEKSGAKPAEEKQPA